MQLVYTKKELKKVLELRKGKRALVMTMGALHAGHLALVAAAKEAAEQVVVSIFVNPLQFAPGEDYEKYPRQLEADLELLAPWDVDVVFAPEVAEIYPRSPQVSIDPGPAAKLFEGKTRPIHFAGVLQVVHKVFNLTMPDYAFFGEKDAQQLALVKAMVEDLDMPLEIKAVPIVREESGLARSSRNEYLSIPAREQAVALYRALQAGELQAQAGAKASQVLATVKSKLEQNTAVKIDYVDIVGENTFLPVDDTFSGIARIILAAWVEGTRLIDNLAVQLI